MDYEVGRGGVMDAYATHLVPLVVTALTTKGPILELGCGDYSTPLLQEIADLQGREFLAQASDVEWAKRFNHVEIVDWKNWVPPKGQWGMVFLDSEEHTMDRYKRLKPLSEITEAIVLHDANIPKYYDVLEGWSLKLYDAYRPNTAVFRKQ